MANMQHKHRMKRLLHTLEGFRANGFRDGLMPTKRPKMDWDDDIGTSTPPSASSLRKYDKELNVSQLHGYESIHRNKPAELFRKDLISAMKLPDTEQLQAEDYYILSDTWKMEWEKGVQVPVNPDYQQNVEISLIKEVVTGNASETKAFRLPKKLVRGSASSYRQASSDTSQENVCRYDLDEQDVAWLHVVNNHRSFEGMKLIEEDDMENIIEEIENECYRKLSESVKRTAGLGIEYDEDVFCDVCRALDAEEGNEMIFCDRCDVCVHQACYGVRSIPEGDWLCRPCSRGLVKPQCVLCSTNGGALKSTKGGTKWAHLSCAFWIPEVGIGEATIMEPITKLSQIPASRWNLCCSLCKQKVGACIQCAVKSCKVAFHVTCGFRNQLEMNTPMEGPREPDSSGIGGSLGDVSFVAYCQRHTKQRQEPPAEAGSDFMPSGSAHQELSQEEKECKRQERIKVMEGQFYNYVECSRIMETLPDFANHEDVIQLILEYWKLKRAADFGKALLTPKEVEQRNLDKEREQSLKTKINMFIHLRHDLERVRNLCYMVIKREKLSRHLFKLRQDIFNKQTKLVEGQRLGHREMQHVMMAGCSTSYDNVCIPKADTSTSVLRPLNCNPDKADVSKEKEEDVDVVGETDVNPKLSIRQTLNHARSRLFDKFRGYLHSNHTTSSADR